MGAVPVLLAVVWVADRVRLPPVVSAVVRVSVQVPDVQVVVAGLVASPLIRGVIVVESPVAVPQVPPIVVMSALVT